MIKSKFFKILSVVVVVFITTILYSSVRMSALSHKIDDLSLHLAVLEKNLASTTSELQVSIKKTHSDFADALNLEKQSVGTIEQRLGTYQQQVGNITGTVSTLQKLSKTDPQLLAKYSKVFFLNENYAPPRLTEIPEKYRYSDTKQSTIHTDVWPHLQALMEDASREGVTLFVSSAYRSFSEQQALKGQYRVTYGAGTANQFSADQGYSEHQLGTAVDFITTGLGGQLDGFDKTKAYEWLLANAYRSGFILSYPKDNNFYVFEPWHWRYVGVRLATDLHNSNQHFYDWDQRKIDEYLVSIFE